MYTYRLFFLLLVISDLNFFIAKGDEDDFDDLRKIEVVKIGNDYKEDRKDTDSSTSTSEVDFSPAQLPKYLEKVNRADIPEEHWEAIRYLKRFKKHRKSVRSKNRPVKPVLIVKGHKYVLASKGKSRRRPKKYKHRKRPLKYYPKYQDYDSDEGYRSYHSSRFRDDIRHIGEASEVVGKVEPMPERPTPEDIHRPTIYTKPKYPETYSGYNHPFPNRQKPEAQHSQDVYLEENPTNWFESNLQQHNPHDSQYYPRPDEIQPYTTIPAIENQGNIKEFPRNKRPHIARRPVGEFHKEEHPKEHKPYPTGPSGSAQGFQTKQKPYATVPAVAAFQTQFPSTGPGFQQFPLENRPHPAFVSSASLQGQVEGLQSYNDVLKPYISSGHSFPPVHSTFPAPRPENNRFQRIKPRLPIRNKPQYIRPQHELLPSNDYRLNLATNDYRPGVLPAHRPQPAIPFIENDYQSSVATSTGRPYVPLQSFGGDYQYGEPNKPYSGLSATTNDYQSSLTTTTFQFPETTSPYPFVNNPYTTIPLQQEEDSSWKAYTPQNNQQTFGQQFGNQQSLTGGFTSSEQIGGQQSLTGTGSLSNGFSNQFSTEQQQAFNPGPFTPLPDYQTNGNIGNMFSPSQFNPITDHGTSNGQQLFGQGQYSGSNNGQDGYSGYSDSQNAFSSVYFKQEGDNWKAIVPSMEDVSQDSMAEGSKKEESIVSTVDIAGMDNMSSMSSSMSNSMSSMSSTMNNMEDMNQMHNMNGTLLSGEIMMTNSHGMSR